MGTGRKTQTLTASEKVPSSWKPNFSASARNLRKSDLGGVIFGCKHSTFRECYFKQLFGLPAPHFSYVGNIDPGLPLFLFNYSDRKLHGVFEAASQGKMNINPYAWTADESKSTAYLAQVKVKIRIQCEPLEEEQFAPLISENYYEKRLFWFELDRNQTKKLISLFSSLPKAVSAATAISKNTEKWSSMFKTSSLAKGRWEGDNRERSPTDFSHPDHANTEVNLSPKGLPQCPLQQPKRLGFYGSHLTLGFLLLETQRLLLPTKCSHLTLGFLHRRSAKPALPTATAAP
ncbi:hypothetical protein UlMin_018069 [Ulmus minor]